MKLWVSLAQGLAGDNETWVCGFSGLELGEIYEGKVFGATNDSVSKPASVGRGATEEHDDEACLEYPCRPTFRAPPRLSRSCADQWRDHGTALVKSRLQALGCE